MSEWERKVVLSTFDHGMVVGARRAGLSISQSAQLLGFSHTSFTNYVCENVAWSDHLKCCLV